MAKFEKGNTFWKRRSKHGRDAIFTDPKKLMEAAQNYFNWCEENPHIKIERGSSEKGVWTKEIEIRRPFLIEELCIYLGVNTKYFNEFKTSETYKNNSDFSNVVTHIEETIYSQKLSGGLSGEFNSNIVARSLGLRDKQDVTSDDQPINVMMIGGREFKV